MDAAWMQSAAHALARRIGMIPPEKFSVDGTRALLREAYQTRASLNHEIARVEDALLRADVNSGRESGTR